MLGYDPFAFTTYEKFILYQYNTQVDGLYYSSGLYYIHCPNINATSTSTDGMFLQKWLEENKIIGTRIVVINKVPDGAVQIDDQLDKAKSPGTGYLITRSDVENEIYLLIPSIFPDFEILHQYPNIIINFKEEITPEGESHLKEIFETNGFPLGVIFKHEPSSETEQTISYDLFNPIVPFRKVKQTLSKNLHSAWEEDEDQWVSLRKQLLNNDPLQSLKPDSFKKKQFRGLVDCTVFPASNIRNYLSIFDQVTLVFPPKERTAEVLKDLGITRDELIDLVSLDKIQLLLPNSIQVYDYPLVESVLETRKSNIHFSRRITAFTFQEAQRRNPFMLPPIPTLDKQVFLRSIEESLHFLNNDVRSIAKNALAKIGHGWVSLPSALNQQTSTFVSQYGIVNVIGPILEHFTKKDRRIELLMAAPPVDWAAATGSVIMPSAHPNSNIAPYCEFIAQFYSGVPNDGVVVPNPGYANFAIEEILAISQHVPIAEFAKSFSSVEISRFRQLVLGISNNVDSPGDLEETISAFNHFVRQYEKDKSKLSIWSLGGFVLGQAGKANGVPYAQWVVNFLLKHVLKQGSQVSKVAGILDAIEGYARGAFPGAIMVSKMKDKLKTKI